MHLIWSRVYNLHTTWINYTDHSKFLGVWLDKNLRWSIHMQKLVNKSCKICFGLRVVRRVTGLETVRTLSYAYFQSLLLYGLIFWGNSVNAELIFRLQKRTIRAMMQIPKTASFKVTFQIVTYITVGTVHINTGAGHSQSRRRHFAKQRPGKPVPKATKLTAFQHHPSTYPWKWFD
jgi:hypothetical protein